MNGLSQTIQTIFRPHHGWFGLAAALLLTCIGLEAIHTAPINPGEVDYASIQGKRWLLPALAAMVVCMFPHPRTIGLAAYPLLAFAVLLLVFLITPGVPREIVPIRNGARSWINLHYMMFQPSEVTKIVFVLALAWYLRYRKSFRILGGLLVPFLIMFIPVGLILKEPDLGTALLFAPTLFAVLAAAGAKLRHLGGLLLVGFAMIAINVAIIAYDAPNWMHLLKPHQEARIKAMLWPQRYKMQEGYQQLVAMRLVGAGQISGVGYNDALTLVRFNGLPFDHNDMIFAVIAIRWGLVGCLLVLSLYLVLVSSFLAVAARSKDPFARLSCVGFAALFFTQFSINIAINIGLLPVTGITLPLVSYGGSSLVATYAMLGLMLNFAAYRPTNISRPSFEFDRSEDLYQ